MTEAELSGRIDTLEARQSYVDQQLLLRPDLSAFSSYQSVNNNQLDAIEDSVNNLTTELSTIRNLLINMNINLYGVQTGLNYYKALLTGHTARFATGSNPTTHTGGGLL